MSSLSTLLRSIPIPARTRVLLSSCGVFACMAVVSGSGASAAFAEAPEVPRAEPTTEVRAATATLRGLLNPGKEGEPGAYEMDTYQFIYRQSSTCRGAGEVETPEGLSLGAGEEAVAQGIEGLLAGREYTACLVVHNSEAAPQEAESVPVHFTTAIVPQTPVTEAATTVTATTVTLHGELNPTAEADTGWHFVYSTEPTCAAGGLETEAVALAKVKAKTKVEAKVTGLQPHKKYVFCLVATNEAEPAEAVQSGNEAVFTTSPAPPAIVSEHATSVSASEVRLEGSLNPDNQITECHFEYGYTNTSENTVPCEPELMKGFGEQAVHAVWAGLEPGKQYHYLIVAENATGEEAVGTEKEVIPPEAPTAEEATAVNTTTATLNGRLDPSGNKSEPGTYEFLYKASSNECELSEAESEQSQKELTEKPPSEVLTPPQKVAPEPAGATAGNSETVSAPLGGLLPGTTYTYCLRETNGAGETALGPPATFTTISVEPVVSNESISQVRIFGVAVSAQIDTGDPSATYRVEYGKTSTHESETTETDLQSGANTVTVQLTGLQPNTEYHFKFHVTNENHETSEGVGASFKTYPDVPGGLLPDNRVYEMVTPVKDEEASVSLLTGWHEPEQPEYPAGFASDRVAADGDAVVYESAPTVGGINGAGNMELSTRTSAGDWTQLNIHPDGVPQIKFLNFSSELTSGIISSVKPLTPGEPQGSYVLKPGASGHQLLPGRFVGESEDGSRAAGGRVRSSVRDGRWRCESGRSAAWWPVGRRIESRKPDCGL